MPSRDDVYRQATGEHQAYARVAQTFQVEPAQSGALTQALKLVGLPLRADQRAILVDRDQ